MSWQCQARGCGAQAVRASCVWCTRHRKLLFAGHNKPALDESETAARGSREWKAAVRRCQDLILKTDNDAARQTEMFHGDP